MPCRSFSYHPLLYWNTFGVVIGNEHAKHSVILRLNLSLLGRPCVWAVTFTSVSPVPQLFPPGLLPFLAAVLPIYFCAVLTIVPPFPAPTCRWNRRARGIWIERNAFLLAFLSPGLSLLLSGEQVSWGKVWAYNPATPLPLSMTEPWEGLSEIVTIPGRIPMVVPLRLHSLEFLIIGLV